MSRFPVSLVGAALACVAALLVLGATLAGALSIEPAPAPPAAAADTEKVAAAAAAPRLSTEALLLAVEHDPFRADRQRSPERYRMPGEEPPVEPEPPPPPPPPPPFRLIGTAVSPTGSVAVIELESSSRMLEIGEEMLGYRLIAVEPERATMESAEQRVDLPLTSSLAAATPPRDQRRNAGRQQPNGDAAAQNARELIERIRQQGGNVTPQLLEQLRRLQAEGRNVDVQVEPGRMMIRTRPDTTSTAPRVPRP
jgi:hypothetical protein